MLDRRSLVGAGLFAAGALASPALAEDAFAPVVARFRRFVDDGDLPFAALRIAQRGRVLAEAHVSGEEAVGPESIYRIYSMTKPVAAAAVVLLVQDGRLTLESPVAEFVPEFADLNVIAGSLDSLEPARPMTVAHLLTHTCGLANSWGQARVAPLYQEAGLVAGSWMHDPAVGGLGEFARRLGALPLEFQPGTNWLYGYGLDVAGLVVERISGERLGDFMRRRIFDPLGMSSTGFHVPAERADRLTGLYTGVGPARRKVQTGAELAPLRAPFADSGSAGLVSTLADYGRFADMLANGGELDGVRVMTAESVRLMTTPYGPQGHIAPALAAFGSGGLGGDSAGVGQALGGVTRLGDDAGPRSAGEYAWGGAASTGFFANPGMGLSMVVMTQLMPSGAVPLRDALRPLVYRALSV